MGRENELLGTARDAFARHDWAAALESFQAARKAVDLSADDWFALADSAWWLGEIEAALDAWQEAHHRYVTTGQPRRAAMAAMFAAAHSQRSRLPGPCRRSAAASTTRTSWQSVL